VCALHQAIQSLRDQWHQCGDKRDYCDIQVDSRDYDHRRSDRYATHFCDKDALPLSVCAQIADICDALDRVHDNLEGLSDRAHD